MTTETLPLETVSLIDQEEEPPSLPEVLGAALRVHALGFAALFGALALASAVCLGGLVRAWRRGQVAGVLYLTALCLQTAFLGVVRAVYLGTDAYNLRGTFHPAVASVMFGVHTATLTSAFLLLYAGLVRITETRRLVKGGLMTPRLIVTVVALNFTVWVVGDSLTALYPQWMPVPYLCDSYFILWGYSYFGLFIYAFWRYHEVAYTNKRVLSVMASDASSQASHTGPRSNQSDAEKSFDGPPNSKEKDPHTKCNQGNASVTKGNHDSSNSVEKLVAKKPSNALNVSPKMPRAMKLALVVAILFFISGSVHVFVSLNRHWLRHLATNPWVWFSVVTTWATIQLAMGVTILYVAALPCLK